MIIRWDIYRKRLSREAVRNFFTKLDPLPGRSRITEKRNSTLPVSDIILVISAGNLEAVIIRIIPVIRMGKLNFLRNLEARIPRKR